VAHFQSQPIGLGRDLSTSALEMTHVELLHFIISALL